MINQKNAVEVILKYFIQNAFSLKLIKFKILIKFQLFLNILICKQFIKYFLINFDFILNYI